MVTEEVTMVLFVYRILYLKTALYSILIYRRFKRYQTITIINIYNDSTSQFINYSLKI